MKIEIIDTARCPYCGCKLLTDGSKVWCFYYVERNPITLLIGEYKAALENQNDRSNNRKMAGIELPPAPPMIEDLSGSISFDDEWEDQSLGT